MLKILISGWGWSRVGLESRHGELSRQLSCLWVLVVGLCVDVVGERDDEDDVKPLKKCVEASLARIVTAAAQSLGASAVIFTQPESGPAFANMYVQIQLDPRAHIILLVSKRPDSPHSCVHGPGVAT